MENCWDFKKCGREPGGARVSEKGVCPAAAFEAADGFLGGRNGGRACAFLMGTFCCEIIPGTTRSRKTNCAACTFYDNLRYLYGREFSLSSFLSYIKVQGKSRSGEVMDAHPFSAIRRTGSPA